MVLAPAMASTFWAMLSLGAIPEVLAMQWHLPHRVNMSSFAAESIACESGIDCFVDMGEGMFCPSGVNGPIVQTDDECKSMCADSPACTGFAVGFCNNAKGPQLKCALYTEPCTFGKYTDVCPTFIGNGYAKGNQVKGVCTLVEDPHISVFDGMQVSLLQGSLATRSVEAPGIKWLVQSGPVHIQARYLPDTTLAEKNMFVEAVAVGGPFLGNSTLVVESLHGNVIWNGEPILKTMPSEFEVAGLVRARRQRGSVVVQDTAQPSAGIDIELPLGVSLVINRFKHHVNVAIEMPQLEGGQDGLCGNFNGIAADDALDIALRRRDPDVLPRQSLFRRME